MMQPGRTATAEQCAASPRLRRPMTTTTDQILYAQPASVHFGGFQLDRAMQQRVRVHNNSAKAVRLRYAFPTGKKGFRATFASSNRPSFVSAGLSEEILVSFTAPAGFQYYYDCIQVSCEEVAYGSSADVARGGSTLIPLHAYPVVNEVSFPSRMDFGVVPRGSCARRQVSITCSVPVAFEYELRVTKPHPSFTIFPLTGSIPPRGEARIELEFRPTIYATASAELELHVSQLGFIPQVCVLAGSSASTAADETSTVEVEERLRSPASPQSETLHQSQKQAGKTSTPRAGTKSVRNRRTPREVPQSEDHDEEEDELEKVRGIEIPHDLTSVAAVTFVLNQEPGKLKPKDLKKAITANRALRQQQREEQAQLSTGNDDNGADKDAIMLNFRSLVREEEGYLQRMHVSNQVKDMFFQQELSDVTQAEKELEFQSHKVHIGQRLLSSKQLNYLVELRQINALALARQQRDKLRMTFINIRYKLPVVFDQSQKDNDEEQLQLLGELKTAVLPAHFIPAYAPDFKPYKNDMWSRRQRVLRRLVRAVSTCVIRLRAQRRLKRIHAWIDGAQTRAQVREKVELDWQRSAQSGTDSEAAMLGSHREMQSDSGGDTPGLPQCYLTSFPVVKENTSQKHRDIIDLPPDWDLKFNSFTFLELKPRDEALLMGHEQIPLPALPTYVPQEQDREIREGAASECGAVISLLPTPGGSFNVAAALHGSGDSGTCENPSLLDLMPADAFLRPAASVRPLVAIQRPRETEPSYALRQQRVVHRPPSNFSAWQSSQVGLQSVVGSHGDASLFISDVFVSVADRKHVEPLFPIVMEGSGSVERLFGDIWDVDAFTLAEQAEDVPNLSDSESDDEAGTNPLSVTWNQASALFEDSLGGQSNVNDSYEDGEMFGQTKGVYSFERYRHLIRQERTYNMHQQDLLDRLPKSLEAVASQIEHPDYALVVQGHGPSRPLHTKAV